MTGRLQTATTAYLKRFVDEEGNPRPQSEIDALLAEDRERLKRLAAQLEAMPKRMKRSKYGLFSKRLLTESEIED
jgi:hypothetical protein